MSDPHVRVFNDTLFLYTGHDSHPDDKIWIMRDWRIFSTTDLKNWKQVGTISPMDNYMGESTNCWAGDAASRNGKYYFYFPAGGQIGVAVSDPDMLLADDAAAHHERLDGRGDARPGAREL